MIPVRRQDLVVIDNKKKEFVVSRILSVKGMRVTLIKIKIGGLETVPRIWKGN